MTNISNGVNKQKIKVILGSIREGRIGIKVAQWFMNAVKENNSADLELVDLKNYDLPVFADSDTVRHREEAHPNSQVEIWLAKVKEADGFIFITPEYNHSYPSALKNAIDYAYDQWNNKPVGFVSYGGSAGGTRAVEHLRQVVAELQMYDVQPQVVITKVAKTFENMDPANFEPMAKTANAMVSKVAELAKKLQA